MHIKPNYEQKSVKNVSVSINWQLFLVAILNFGHSNLASYLCLCSSVLLEPLKPSFVTDMRSLCAFATKLDKKISVDIESMMVEQQTFQQPS